MSITTGLTLYSLTPQFWTGQYDLQGLLTEVSARGLGPGIEIVGFQSIPTYPDVEDNFVRSWRDVLERNGLVGSCLSSNIDIGAMAGRDLNVEEMVAYLERQIEVARKLAFPIIRIQIGADARVIERALPTAERAGVVLGMEIHAPESPVSDLILPVRDLYERLDSPNLGFIPDFSSTMRSVPRRWLRRLVDGGLPQEVVPELERAWALEGSVAERHSAWEEAAAAAGVDPVIAASADGTFSMFGHEDPSVWREIADRIVHVHGKFYEIDDSGEETSIDYPAIIGELEAMDYDGFISSEWEGHTLFEPDEADAFQQVGAQQDLISRSLTRVQA